MSSLFSILWCSRLQSYILKKEKKLISQSSVNVHTCFFLTGITSLFSTLWNSFLQSKKKNWFCSLRWEFTHASLSPGLRAFSRPSGTAFSKVKKIDFRVLICASAGISLSSLTPLFRNNFHILYTRIKNYPADHTSGRCRGNDEELIKSNCLGRPAFPQGKKLYF